MNSLLEQLTEKRSTPSTTCKASAKRKGDVGAGDLHSPGAGRNAAVRNTSGDVEKQGNKVKDVAEMMHNKTVGQPNFLQGVPADTTRAECLRRLEYTEWRNTRKRTPGRTGARRVCRSVSSGEV